MRWSIDHSDVDQVETTAFGIHMLDGNYEFAGLVLVQDLGWWSSGERTGSSESRWSRRPPSG
jgi:hypothetical protein